MSIVLTELNIYPVKSAKGFSVQTAQVEKTGLRGDRRWMIVDRQGKFMTQRQHPRMALIGVALEDDHLTLSAAGMERLRVPYGLEDGAIEVEVWGDRCQALPAGEQARAWLTQCLGLPCQLVYMHDPMTRPVRSKYAIDPGEDSVSFADAFPFLLISEASLQDLNGRLAEPIPMNRFRPNLVVSGCEPFAEDGWKQIRIGSVVFRLVKPCDRCAVTTVDQATGVMGKEPLITLAAYRLRKGKILFGQNLIHGGLGRLTVGDAVEVLEVGETIA